MNSTENTSGTAEVDPRSTAAVVLQSASMVIIVIAAVGGNLLILAAIYIDKTLQTVTNAFIVNLACADFLLAVLGMPFTLVSSITYTWIFSNTWCEINGMANSLFCVASILTLGAVSIDRYIAIIHPFRYSLWMTRKTAVALIVYVWLHSFMIAILPVLGWSNYAFLIVESICTVHWKGDVAFTIFLFAVCFFLPLAVIMFAYYKIFQTANKQSKRIVPVTGKILAPAELVDEDISSTEFACNRVCRQRSLASVNSEILSETEDLRDTAYRKKYRAAEPEHGANEAELTDSGPASKDSGFEESNNSSSVPTVFIVQRQEQLKLHLRRDSSDNLIQADENMHNSVTSANVSPKETRQGATLAKELAEVGCSGRISEGATADSWVKVPTWFVESPNSGGDLYAAGEKADSYQNLTGSSKNAANTENGGITSAPKGSQYEIQNCTGRSRENRTTVELSLRDQSCNETTDRQRPMCRASGNIPSPIPVIVSSAATLTSDSRKEDGKKRRKSSASGVFSVSDANLLSPALTVLGQKSITLLRKRRKSADYRSKMRRDRKAAKTIVIVLGTFILLWAPHFIGIFCFLIDTCSWPAEFYAATTWLAMLNSACNPIIYGVMSRQFRKRFLQILRCRRGFF